MNTMNTHVCCWCKERFRNAPRKVLLAIVAAFPLVPGFEAPCAFGQQIAADSDGDATYFVAVDGSDTWSGTENWTRDCQGNVVNTEPFYTNTEIQSMFQTGAPSNKGFVLVEIYYCYEQVLNLPVLSDFIDNPIRIHVYSIMPAFEAIPTPTPITE